MAVMPSRPARRARTARASATAPISRKASGRVQRWRRRGSRPARSGRGARSRPSACRRRRRRRRPRSDAVGSGAGIVASPRITATIERAGSGAELRRRRSCGRPMREPAATVIQSMARPSSRWACATASLTWLVPEQPQPSGGVSSALRCSTVDAVVGVVDGRTIASSRRPLRWVSTATRSPLDVVNSWRTPTPGSSVSWMSGMPHPRGWRGPSVTRGRPPRAAARPCSGSRSGPWRRRWWWRRSPRTSPAGPCRLPDAGSRWRT